MRKWSRPLRLIAGVVAMFAVVACSSDSNGTDNGSGATETATMTATADGPGGEATSIDVELNEFELNPSSDTASSGEVTFTIDNAGAIPHEFVIVRTDGAPGDLPIADGKADLTASGVDLVDQVQEIAPGANEELTVDLEPGSYVLLCNIGGHYQSGMHAAFTVN